MHETAEMCKIRYRILIACRNSIDFHWFLRKYRLTKSCPPPNAIHVQFVFRLTGLCHVKNNNNNNEKKLQNVITRIIRNACERLVLCGGEKLTNRLGACARAVRDATALVPRQSSDR